MSEVGKNLCKFYVINLQSSPRISSILVETFCTSIDFLEDDWSLLIWSFFLPVLGALLTIVLLMKSLDPDKYEEAISNNLLQLETLDGKRQNYYRDLSKPLYLLKPRGNCATCSL